MTSDERPLGGPAITPEDGSLYDDCDELQPDVASSKASLASSVYNYRYENGRRYHAYREGEYVIPNDEREQDRLDLLHHIFLLVLNGELYSAPIPKGISRVLDLGTGTGTWAIDMADQNPQAIVTGTDLSPIQSTWVAPNCNFEIDDFELDWNFSYSFDFIHARNIEGSVRDYHKLFGQALKYLNDDGWFELAEPTVGVFCDDDTIARAPSFLEWRDKLIEASIIFKKPMAVAKNYKNWLIDAGFVNVKEEIYKVPFSAWAKDPKMKEIGMYQQAMMLEALDAYSYALFTRVLGWSTAQIQVLLAGVRKELCDPKFHGYSRYYFVYGQKPSPSTS